MSDLHARLAASRTRGLLLDANLLVLYVVGAYDRRRIGQFKATKSSGFGERDFVLIADLVATFDRVVTTPHLLTEVNGLLNVGALKKDRWGMLGAFADRIGELVEVLGPASGLTTDPDFRRFGLADAAILSLAKGGPLVLSTDLDLCLALESRGLDVINYHHIRPL